MDVQNRDVAAVENFNTLEVNVSEFDAGARLA